MLQVTDRLRGISVGAVVGDALGMPLEFQLPRPVYDLETEMIEGALPAGSFTDDTEMALALAESLLAHSPLDPDDLAERFLSWYKGNPPDIGIHTSLVLGKIADGVPWQEASQLDPLSASNGSLMRNWPVAIACWNDPEQLERTSRLQSQITHTNADCVNACAWVNLLLRELVLRPPELSPDAALRQAILDVSERVDLGSEFRLVVDLAGVRSRDRLANSGWVRHTVESALWAVLTTRSFEEALVQAVNLGNDADTTGSVAGAIAGALYGLVAIPRRWKTVLHGECPLHSGQYWYVQDFIILADRLSQGSSAL